MIGSGIGHLAGILDMRNKHVVGNEVGTAASYGEIRSNGGLKVDDFSKTLPNGAYTVCKSAGELSKGDRVLVVWVNGEPCIVDTLEGK